MGMSCLQGDLVDMQKVRKLGMCPPIFFTGHYCYLNTGISVIRFPWSLVDGLISCSNIDFDTLSSSCGHKVKFHIKHSGCIIKLVSGKTCRCGREQCISLEQKLHKVTLSPPFGSILQTVLTFVDELV